jgi:hypothetical protein
VPAVGGSRTSNEGGGADAIGSNGARSGAGADDTCDGGAWVGRVGAGRQHCTVVTGDGAPMCLQHPCGLPAATGTGPTRVNTASAKASRLVKKRPDCRSRSGCIALADGNVSVCVGIIPRWNPFPAPHGGFNVDRSTPRAKGWRLENREWGIGNREGGDARMET